MREKIEGIEKEVLGKTIRELFFEMENEVNKRFFEVKKNLLNGIENKKKDIFVETILVKKEESYKFNEAFFPVISRNDYKEIGKDIFLENVYLDFSLDKIAEIEEEEFLAWIDIENESFEVKVSFERDKRYFEEVKRLWEVFELNGRQWKTLNMAHFMRMYKVKLVDYDFEMTKEILEGIQNQKYEVNYEFGRNEDDILRGYELLWNIEKKQIMSTIFVRPVKMDISFEYVLEMSENETMLVKNSEENDVLCGYIEKENTNKLHIISKKNNGTIWNIYAIKNIETCNKVLEINKNLDSEKYNKECFHFTNYYEKSFIEKIQEDSINNFRSMSFFKKKFLDYKFLREEISLIDISFNKKESNYMEIINYNEGLFEALYKKRKKKDKINFFVKINEKTDYSIDKINFVLSEIQLKIPEYDCRGVLYGEY